MTSTDKSAAEREAFEKKFPSFWSYESFVDDEGQRIYCDDLVQGAWIAWTTLSQDASLPPADPGAVARRCPNCDDTGDVHSVDGQWRGVCHCPAGQASYGLTTPSKEPAGAVAIADAVVRFVGEMDDRTSPEDWPEAMLVTGPELHAFILLAFEREAERALAAPGAAIDAREQEADTGDSLYVAGMRAGWNYAVSNNGTGFEAHVERLRRDALASRPEAPPASAPAVEVAQTVTGVSWDWLRGVIKGTPAAHPPIGFIREIPLDAVLSWIDEAERRAALASSPSSAPAGSGWQWAPKEPTEDMLFAAEMSKARGFRELYMTMLANAPQAVQAGGEGGA